MKLAVAVALLLAAAATPARAVDVGAAIQDVAVGSVFCGAKNLGDQVDIVAACLGAGAGAGAPASAPMAAPASAPMAAPAGAPMAAPAGAGAVTSPPSDAMTSPASDGAMMSPPTASGSGSPPAGAGTTTPPSPKAAGAKSPMPAPTAVDTSAAARPAPPSRRLAQASPAACLPACRAAFENLGDTCSTEAVADVQDPAQRAAM
jgi:hypothetical protein